MVPNYDNEWIQYKIEIFVLCFVAFISFCVLSLLFLFCVLSLFISFCVLSGLSP